MLLNVCLDVSDQLVAVLSDWVVKDNFLLVNLRTILSCRCACRCIPWLLEVIVTDFDVTVCKLVQAHGFLLWVLR